MDRHYPAKIIMDVLATPKMKARLSTLTPESYQLFLSYIGMPAVGTVDVGSTLNPESTSAPVATMPLFVPIATIGDTKDTTK
jgi:hypothetical protein